MSEVCKIIVTLIYDRHHKIKILMTKSLSELGQYYHLLKSVKFAIPNELIFGQNIDSTRTNTWLIDNHYYLGETEDHSKKLFPGENSLLTLGQIIADPTTCGCWL